MTFVSRDTAISDKCICNYIYLEWIDAEAANCADGIHRNVLSQLFSFSTDMSSAYLQNKLIASLMAVGILASELILQIGGRYIGAEGEKLG